MTITTQELNLKKIIAESREIAQALDEFADKLEKIEKKHAENEEDTSEKLKYSDNGFPYFMKERTEDDLDESEDEEE